jgi:hypothetical protein
MSDTLCDFALAFVDLLVHQFEYEVAQSAINSPCDKPAKNLLRIALSLPDRVKVYSRALPS